MQEAAGRLVDVVLSSLANLTSRADWANRTYALLYHSRDALDSIHHLLQICRDRQEMFLRRRLRKPRVFERKPIIKLNHTALRLEPECVLVVSLSNESGGAMAGPNVLAQLKLLLQLETALSRLAWSAQVLTARMNEDKALGKSK